MSDLALFVAFGGLFVICVLSAIGAALHLLPPDDDYDEHGGHIRHDQYEMERRSRLRQQQTPRRRSTR